MIIARFAAPRTEPRGLARSTARRLAAGLLALGLSASPGYGQPLQADSTGPGAAAVAAPGAGSAVRLTFPAF